MTNLVGVDAAGAAMADKLAPVCLPLFLPASDALRCTPKVLPTEDGTNLQFRNDEMMNF